VTAFVAVPAIGVIRRWRWTFWLVLIAFLAGPLRIVAAALELLGLTPATGPTWYVAAQGLIGATQLAIGVTLLRTYRRHGVWGRPAKR
jgi:hypothetical protein